MSLRVRLLPVVGSLAFALAGCVGTLDLNAAGADKVVNAKAGKGAKASPAPRAKKGSPAPSEAPASAAPSPGAPASRAPSSKPSTAPAASIAPSLPDPAIAAACSASSPAATPVVASAKHGRYANRALPNAWDNLESEAKITESLAKFRADAATGDAAKVNQWACVNKFYGGMLTVFAAIEAGGGAPAPGPTLPLPSSAATASPAASDVGTCETDEPPVAPATGTSAHGGYHGQLMPAGWATAFTSEAEVTAEIRKLEGGALWPCFQKYYPGTTALYLTKK